jgi:gliding motility-associated-like protein
MNTFFRSKTHCISRFDSFLKVVKSYTHLPFSCFLMASTLFLTEKSEAKIPLKFSLKSELAIGQDSCTPRTFSVVLTPPRCNGGSDGVITIDNVKGGTPPYTFTVKGETFTNQLFVTNLKGGDYKVSLIDKKGCKLDTLIILENPTPLNIYTTKNQEVKFGDSFQLWATANHNLDTFFWSDRSIRTLDTIIKPLDSQNFSLAVVDEFGCSKTTVVQITVRRDNLYFPPEAFSPNNDNINDFYQIHGGKTVVSIDDMKIFDRSGALLFTSPRVFPAPENMGWDGRINGREALPDAYLFSATITYVDGRKELIKGDFTLMR